MQGCYLFYTPSKREHQLLHKENEFNKEQQNFEANTMLKPISLESKDSKKINENRSTIGLFQGSATFNNSLNQENVSNFDKNFKNILFSAGAYK